MQETLDQIRTQISQWVSTHASRESSKKLQESILLKDGCLHGYRFCIGSVEAIWIVDQDSVDIRRDGRLAASLSLDGDNSERRAA